MSIFAILKPNLSIGDVEEVFITTAISSGHQAYVFIASNVNFETRRIVGKTIEKGNIVEREFEFPDVIQNRLAVKSDDKDIYMKLSEEIPFTSNRIGTKKQVDTKLSKIEGLEKYVLNVESCDSLSILLNFLKEFKKIILKPSSGNQGKGIFTVENSDGGFIVKNLNIKQQIESSQISDFFDKNIKNKSYTISKFFKSETNNGLSTVFRMHITRGELGRWKLIKFFPYININNNLDITNGMQGALITTREKMFLEEFYPESYKKIMVEVNDIFKKFTHAFQRQYAWRLDALGLDLGINQNGEIVIFEVNAGPGVGFMAYPVAKAQVKYYEWLKLNAVKPFRNNFLPLNLR